MKRNLFDKETEITGRNFNELINEFGGKTAGIHLLDAGIRYFLKTGRLKQPPQNQRQLLTFGSNPADSLPFHQIPTTVYKLFEEIMKRNFGSKSDAEMHSFRTEEGRRDIDNLNDMWSLISKVIRECEEEFPYQVKASSNASAPAYAPSFHLRSSATSEDFRDDRHFGTFGTIAKDAFFYDYHQRCLAQGRRSLLELMTDFYIQKFHSNGRFDLYKNDLLGMLLMPTICEYADKEVILYSAYPEDPSSPAIMEVWGNDREIPEKGPIELIRMTKDGIERIPAYVKNKDTESKKEELPEEDARFLFELSRAFQEVLLYPVNLEVTVAPKYLVPIQLRPVPCLPENGVLSRLPPVSEDDYVVAETPFVMGSFNHRAPLVKAHYKNDYQGHKFQEKVIIWHTESEKGHRFYYNDPKCIAMINPQEGAVLTHSASLLPSFGEGRDNFAFVGLPFKGLAEKLEKCMVTREEPTARGQGNFSYTPFPITIQSDGRRGRVTVNKTYAHHFKD